MMADHPGEPNCGADGRAFADVREAQIVEMRGPPDPERVVGTPHIFCIYQNHQKSKNSSLLKYMFGTLPKSSQGWRWVGKWKLLRILRMGVPIMEDLSGLQESVLSMSRNPQFHCGRNRKLDWFCIAFNDVFLFPPFGSLLCLVFRDRSMNPCPACLIPVYTPKKACSQHIVFAGPTLSLPVPHCLCGSHIVFEGALCTEPRQGRDYTRASWWDIIIWYAKDGACKKEISKCLGMEFSIVEKLSGPQESIFSLSRRP